MVIQAIDFVSVIQSLCLHLALMLVLKHNDVVILLSNSLLKVFDILAVHLDLTVLFSQILLESLQLLILVVALYLFYL